MPLPLLRLGHHRMHSYSFLVPFSKILLIIFCGIYLKFDVNSCIDWCSWNSSSWPRYHVDRPSNGWFTRGFNYIDHCCRLVLVSIPIDSFASFVFQFIPLLFFKEIKLFFFECFNYCLFISLSHFSLSHVNYVFCIL